MTEFKDPSLESRVAIVTGGSAGIGGVISRRLVQQGARVVIAGTSEERGQSFAHELRSFGGNAIYVSVDVSDPGQVSGAIDTAVETYGRLDILVANAGIPGPTAKLQDISVDEWNSVLGVNLTGVFLCCKFAVPVMQRAGWGRIVIIGSVSGKRPLPLRTPYGASKLALVGLARSLAVEVGPDGITVNVISPFDVDGTRLDGVLARLAAAQGRDSEELRREHVAATALGRLVTADDVAEAALFLCTEGAAAITGQDLNLSAGAVMY